MSRWTLDDLARLVDHTNLHADATEADMAKLCDEAKAYHFKMVAINQVQSKFCSEYLAGTDIHTGAAIAFPLGQTSIAAKVNETKDAIANGANEIDYVVNLTQVKAGNWDYVEDEMTQIVAACQVSSELLLTCFHSPVRSGGEAGSLVCSPPLLAGVLPQAQMDSAKTAAIRNTEIFFIFDLFPR